MTPPPEAPPEALADRASSRDGDRLFFHASAVALEDKGVLILGPSGSGKSTLALALLAQGTKLICDDGVWLKDGQLHRPDKAPDLIEARGVGLLFAGPIRPQAPLSLVVDLSRAEPKRLPPRRMVSVQDQRVELILAAGQTTLAASLIHLLRHGRADPDIN
ncbi:HPr kinase/phosphorylase [Gymnodinialimonas sp.]